MEYEARNTDKELYREPTEKHGEGYEPKVWVTENGSIGMEHYGTCVVKSIEGWVLAVWGQKPSLKWLRDEEFKQKDELIRELAEALDQLWAETGGARTDKCYKMVRDVQSKLQNKKYKSVTEMVNALSGWKFRLRWRWYRLWQNRNL